MKKVELHIHLDGSVRPSTVSELLNIDVDIARKNMVVSDDNQSLTEYLTKFELPKKVMQTKENLRRIAKELAEDLKQDGVIYAEVRFAPVFHTKEGLSYDEIVESVLSGFNSVSGIKINTILCMMRGISYEDNLKTISCAFKYLNKGVVALDLAGDESKYENEIYEPLFKIAKEKNIPYTIHAGEARGAESVKSAISLGARRIGHGINIINDEKVLSEVIKENVVLEVCPTSNLQTKAINNYHDHPIKKLYDKGVLITINTDNNTVSNITLTSEYDRLKKEFNFSNKDFVKMNKIAIMASFASKEDKKEIYNILKEEV